MPRSSAALVFFGLFTMAGPVAAQDDDWDLGRDPEKKAVVAAITFDNFGVAVRCVDRRLSVMMSGMPPGMGERTFGLAMGEGATTDTTWISAGDGTTVFSLWPTSTAHLLRQGGRLRVTMAMPNDAPHRRLVVDLPASEASVAAVFQACDKALPETVVDVDAVASRVNMAGLQWTRRPQPRFPLGHSPAYNTGVVALRCDTDDEGFLKRCSIESEYPDDGGFGRAAQIAAHSFSQVGVTEGDPANVGGRAVAFLLRFSATNDYGPTIPSRLNRGPAAQSIRPRDE